MRSNSNIQAVLHSPALPWMQTLFCYDAAQARSHLAKSEVVDNDTGEGKNDSVRTSSGAFFGVGEDPVRTAAPPCRPLLFT